MITEANQFLTAGGSPAAKFPTIGALVKGTIVDAEVRDQTDMDTGAVLTWADGTAKKQVVITLDTGDPDPAIDGDDGHRRIFAKGQMLTAIRNAVKPHGGLAVGGKLAVKYVGDGEQAKRGFSPPKIYKAQYEPPARTVDLPADEDMF